MTMVTRGGDIELAEGTSKGRRSPRGGRDGIEKNGSGDVTMNRAMKRQDGCCIVAFVVFLVAFCSFFVARIYMAPDALGVELGHEGEGGTLGNNANNAVGKGHEQSDDSKFNIIDWLTNKGKNTPHFSPDDPRLGNNDGGNHSSLPYPGISFPGRPTPGGQHVPHQDDEPPGTEDGGNPAAVSPAGSEYDDIPPFQRKAFANKKITIQDGKKYRVIKQLQHDAGAFIEGLAYAEGVLFESTGLNGKSTIRTLDKVTGQIIQSHPLDSKYFGEGLTVCGSERAFQLTYKAKTGFIYNIQNLDQEPEAFTFESTTGEGWGLTCDLKNDELIMSDGSEFLHFIDSHTMEQKRKVKVKRLHGAKSDQINELEYFHGMVLANIWHEDTIIVINPKNGKVVKEYDFSDLWPLAERQKSRAGVLNGISRADHPSLIYVTGKNWDRMFLVLLDMQ